MASIFAWSASWSLAQDVDVAVGGFHGLGPPVDLSNPTSIEITSEFGAYGQQVYLQLSAFF